MLKPRTIALLKKVIATIPHDNCGAFKESDLVERLAEKLPALLGGDHDENEWIHTAKWIVKEAKKDDGTPADGVLALPGFEPYPWLPDQLLSDGHGYLIRQADATPEFTQHAAKVAALEAQAAARVVSAYNN